MRKRIFFVCVTFFISLFFVSAIAGKNSLDELSLKGNVTSLVLKVHEAGGQSGQVKKKKLLYTSTYHFDQEGHLVDYLFESPKGYKVQMISEYKDGRVVRETEGSSINYYTYDKNGNVKEKQSKGEDGSLLSRIEYKYDKKDNCISQTEYNEMSCLGVTDMKYNSNGLLIEKTFSGNEGEDTRQVYTYDKNNHIEKEEVYDYENNLTHLYTYVYITDNQGNWTERIKADKGTPFEISERVFVYNGTVVAAPASKSVFTLENLIGSLLMLFLIFMTGHMLFIIYQGKRYKVVFTPAYFSTKRQEAGFSPSESDAEVERAGFLLNQAFEQWSLIDTDLRKPTKMKQIKASVPFLDEVISMNPLNPEIIDRLNECADVINTNEARTFDGSKTIIVIGLLFAAFFSYVSSGTDSFWKDFFTTGYIMWGPVIVYILASRTPNFLLDKKRAKNGGAKSHGILLFILGIMGSGYTVRTTTKYDDGTKDVSDDHSAHFIAWFLAFLVMMIIAALIWLWAIFNYLRNYVLYF